MKKHYQIFGIAVAVTLIALVVGACSSDKEKSKSRANQSSDTTQIAMNENITANGPAAASVSTTIPASVPEVYRDFYDMKIVGGQLMAAYDGGVAVYDFKTKQQRVIPVTGRVEAIARHEDKTYLGGDELYVLNDTSLELVDADFVGCITALFSFGDRLMIGTESSLYARGPFGKELLMEGVTVSALTSDGDALWVGTDGDGLYRWDGQKFQQRYLLRDTAFFDYINTLDYGHNHVYVGTSHGLHIFDGGKWLTLTDAEGLPSNNVTSVDASDWTVFVATDKGVVAYHNDSLSAVNKLEDKNVKFVQRRGLKLAAVVENEGLVLKTGNRLDVIFPAEAKTETDLLSMAR